VNGASTFSADRPIDDIPQDRLGRSRFASKLAEAVCAWNEEKDGLVLALYGDWGSGKTSLKNLFKCYCAKGKDPYVVEFNPWQWSGQDKIFEAFFQQVGIRLGKHDVSKRSAKLAKKWKYYAACWGLASELTGHLRRAVTTFLVIGWPVAVWGFALVGSERWHWALVACLCFLSETS
jgi:predicted KAP-like P-loop ATPase